MSYKPFDEMAEISRRKHQRGQINRVIKQFSKAMKDKMLEHLDRPGWKGEDVFWLAGRLKEEADELFFALDSFKPQKEILEECADVANFAMMIADVYKGGQK